MPKRTKKTLPTCEQHLFILKAKHNFCRFGQTATISFCDLTSDKNKNKNKKCRNCEALDCPIYNQDKNFATPTFILSSQKQYYQDRGIKMREQHEKKMIEYTDEKDSLNVPKPRTKNNFCSVCRQVYEDYLDHIESQKHKKKINSSLFNKYILDAADKFNPNFKNIYPFNLTLSTGDQDDVEVIQNRPMKKVKSDYQMHQRNLCSPQGNKSSIAPPPHLNVNNATYFPGFNPSISFIPGQIHPFQIQSINPQIGYNYNINMYMNPFYNSHPFAMMNPWMNCYQMHQMNGHNYQKMNQNYFMQQGIQQKMVRNSFGQEMYMYGNEQKQQIIQNHQQIIVIDDDDEQYGQKPIINV